MSEAKLSAQLRDEAKKAEKVKKPVTASDLLNKGFKKPSARAIKQGKARLLMEDMVHRAERKLEELRKTKAATASALERAEMLADELYHKPGTLLTEEETAKMYIESECEEERMFNRSCFDIPTVNTFRTIDGVCNNLEHPLQGASDTAFRRLIDSDYEDGIDSLRGTQQANDPDEFFKPPNPSARYASTTIIRDRVQFETNFSHLVMQFGQFLDHDLDLGPEFEEECEDCEFTEQCIPIRVPEDDETFGLGTLQNGDCLPFRRSIPICSDPTPGSLTPREQINVLTSYIDGSMIYGSNLRQERAVRAFQEGRLKVGIRIGDGDSLPVDNQEIVACPGRDDCFLCGDVRCNEQVSLTIMHTLWVREHNRIAKQLMKINSQLSDETLYQEARKIVGAIIQKIVYFDYLPKVMGPEVFDEMIGQFERYDPEVDASVPNVFATAAYRYGHSLIRPFFDRLRPNFTPRQPALNLAEMFFNPPQFANSGGVGPVARGWTAVNARRVDEFMNTVLTTQLFVTEDGPGMDLAALNIQRSRDHGLPVYGRWRNFCEREFPQFGKARIENELTFVRLYNTFGDVDYTEPWVGGLAEERLENSLLGLTFACIFGLTFKNVRDGDRFYFEHPGVFTEEQLAEIRKCSFSRVICDNTNTNSLQPDAFLTNQTRVSCTNTAAIPSIDLNLWKLPLCYVRISVPAGQTIASRSSVIGRRANRKTLTNTDKPPSECLPTQCPDQFNVRFIAFATPRRAACTISTNGQFTNELNSKRTFRRTLIKGDPDLHTSLESCQQDTTPALTFTCTSQQVNVAEGDDVTNNPENPDYTGEVPEELKEILREEAEEGNELVQTAQSEEETVMSKEEHIEVAEVQDKELLKELQDAMEMLTDKK